MTDIHSHILYGVDDGAVTLKESLALLMQCAEQGVDGVICTPHQSGSERRTKLIKDRFAQLCKAAEALPVRLYLGAEIYYYDGMKEALRAGELLTLGGSAYVLVEFSLYGGMTDIPDAVYELSIMGYRPIVAHAERYGYLSREDFFNIRENGGLIQVNAHAFSQRPCRKLLKFLLRNDMLDFVASDCHRAEGRNVDFTAAKAYVRKRFPNQYEKLFGDNGKIFRR